MEKHPTELIIKPALRPAVAVGKQLEKVTRATAHFASLGIFRQPQSNRRNTTSEAHTMSALEKVRPYARIGSFVLVSRFNQLPEGLDKDVNHRIADTLATGPLEDTTAVSVIPIGRQSSVDPVGNRDRLMGRSEDLANGIREHTDIDIVHEPSSPVTISSQRAGDPLDQTLTGTHRAVSEFESHVTRRNGNIPVGARALVLLVPQSDMQGVWHAPAREDMVGEVAVVDNIERNIVDDTQHSSLRLHFSSALMLGESTTFSSPRLSVPIG